MCTSSDNQGVRLNGLNLSQGDGNDFLNPGGFATANGTYKTATPFATFLRDTWYNLIASRASGTLNMIHIGHCDALQFFGGLLSRSFYGYMTDMITYSTKLSPSDYNTINAPYTAPLTGTPLFTQLSQAATSSAVGAFSLRAVNGVTAKAVQIRRSSDSATQDFWADSLGNLLTAPVTGQLLQNWLGGSTATLLTWYDQSGRGNNATGTSTIYKTSNVNMQWAIQSGSLLTVSSPSTFITNSNFTIHSVTRRTTTSTSPSNQSIYAYTPGNTWNGTVAYNRITVLYNTAGNRLALQSVNTSIAQYSVITNSGCGLYSTSGPVDYLSVIWNGSTTQMYYNGSTSASSAAAMFDNIPNTNNFYLLGCPAYGSVVGGEFGEVIVFNTALSAADVSTLYLGR